MILVLSAPTNAVAQSSKDSIDMYYQYIVAPQQPENLTAGLNFYLKKKQRDLIKKDTLNAIYDLRLLAIGEFKIGDYYESENYVVEALELINSMPSKDNLIDNKVGLYNQLGRVYRASNNSTPAIKAFNEALALTQKTKDSIIILNNKANVYKDELDFDSAKDIYSLLYQKNIETQDSLQIAMVLNNLGYAQLKTGSSDALQNLATALKINENINELGGQHSSNSYLAEYYLDRKDTAQARAYSNKALELAKYNK